MRGVRAMMKMMMIMTMMMMTIDADDDGGDYDHDDGDVMMMLREVGSGPVMVIVALGWRAWPRGSSMRADERDVGSGEDDCGDDEGDDDDDDDGDDSWRLVLEDESQWSG
jgi:hypothetical protein